MVKAVIRSMRSTVAGVPRAYWICAALPIFFSILLLVSLGPTLQNSIFSAASAEAPNLYDAQFKGAIARQPGLGQALLAALTHLHFVAIALVTTLVATLRRSLSSVFVWIALSILISWSIGDAFISPNIVENVVANAVGGICVASIVVFSLGIARDAQFQFAGLASKRAVFATVVLATSFVAFFAALWGIKFYYDAPPASVELSSKPRLEGFFLRAESPKVRSFDFLPAQSQGKISIQSSEGRPFISLALENGSLARTLEIAFHVNCFGSQLTDAEFAAAAFSFGTAEVLQIESDDGPAIIRTNIVEHEASYKTDFGTFFWVDLDADKARVSFFSTPKDRSYIKTADDFIVDSSLSMHLIEAKRIKRSIRAISIVREGKRQVIEFVPDRQRNPGQILQCRPLRLDAATQRKLASGESISVNVGTFSLAGVRIAMRNQEGRELQEGVGQIPDRLEIGGFLGSTDFEELPSTSLRTGDPSPLSGISVSAASARLLVNDKVIEVVPTDRIALFGELESNYQRDGSIGISGMAEAAWKNGTRLNQTRWERLPGEWKLPIIGFVFGAISAIVAFGWARVRLKLKEDPKGWM